MAWTVHIPYLYDMLIIAIVEEYELVIFNYDLFWSAFCLKFSGILVICAVYTVIYLISQLDDWCIHASCVCVCVCVCVCMYVLCLTVNCSDFCFVWTAPTCSLGLHPCCHHLDPKCLFWLCKNRHPCCVTLCIMNSTFAFYGRRRRRQSATKLPTIVVDLWFRVFQSVLGGADFSMANEFAVHVPLTFWCRMYFFNFSTPCI